MIKLFKKDLKLFFKDKKGVFLTFLLPVILIALFNFAFGGLIVNADPEPVDLLITDQDNTQTSVKLIKRLDSLNSLKITNVDWDESENQVRKGNFVGALILLKGLEDSLKSNKNIPLEILYDDARLLEIDLIKPLLINTLSAYLSNPKNERISSETPVSFIKTTQPPSSPEKNGNQLNLQMTSIIREKETSNLGLIQAVTGTSIMMLLFSVAALGASILDEKESGTLKRLLFSPLNSNTILLGKFSFTFFIALLQLTVMFLFAWLVFKLNIFINFPALILMIACTAFAISSFGIFLASISRTRQQAQSLGTLVILIMSALGGSMIPLFIMPAFMRKLAAISVNYWGIQGFFDIFWRKLPLAEIFPKMLILIAFGCVMTTLSIWLFKKNVMQLL